MDGYYTWNAQHLLAGAPPYGDAAPFFGKLDFFSAVWNLCMNEGWRMSTNKEICHVKHGMDIITLYGIFPAMCANQTHPMRYIRS